MFRILALILAFALPLTTRAEVVDIDNAELARLLASKVPIIDIRTAPEWRDTGVIPGSHLLTFFDERGHADPAAWLAKANATAKPSEPVIIICRSGNRSGVVSRFLSERAGFSTVYNVKGGIQRWLSEGRPRVPGV